jgi:hypothetical protein
MAKSLPAHPPTMILPLARIATLLAMSLANPRSVVAWPSVLKVVSSTPAANRVRDSSCSSEQAAARWKCDLLISISPFDNLRTVQRRFRL